MKDTRMFIAFWVINSALFYFSPYVLTGMVVTGNARLAPFLASIISGFLLSCADSLVMPVFEGLKIKLKDEWQWMLAFLLTNILGVWVIARYADLTGVGVSTGWTAILLGLSINIAQWIAWKVMADKTKKTR